MENQQTSHKEGNENPYRKAKMLYDEYLHYYQ